MNKYQEALNRMSEAYYNLDNSLSAMERFAKDIDLIQCLVDKETPNKPIKGIRGHYECPTYCGYDWDSRAWKSKYCPSCGQRIDWSEEK